MGPGRATNVPRRMRAMDIAVVEYEGGIDEFPQLVQTVDNLISDGANRLVIDLATLPFINSSALGYFIRVLRTLEEKGGELTLARVQPAIRNILQITNLDDLF